MFLQQKIADLDLSLPAHRAGEFWRRCTAGGDFDPAEADAILAEVALERRLARWQAQQQGGRPRGCRAA